MVVAGAAGLRLGWAVIAPGDRLRRDALADEGRRSVVIVIGLVLVLIVAGIIEGFVTGSSLPTLMRLGIGVAVEAAFVAWIVVQGRQGEACGITGLLGERPRTWAEEDTTDLAATHPREAGEVPQVGVATGDRSP